MALFLVTPPSGDVVTRAEAKQQLQVDHADEDDLIDALLLAAVDHVESFTRRPLLTQTWQLKLDAFPSCGAPIELLKAPVSAVSSIVYTATDGTSTTWGPSHYETDLPVGPHAAPARIRPVFAEYYPLTRCVMNAVVVTFVCGYGAAEDVPPALKAAIKILVATWFGPGRQAVAIGGLVNEIPTTVNALLWPYRVF